MNGLEIVAIGLLVLSNLMIGFIYWGGKKPQ